MNKLKLITYILRWILSIMVFVVSSISISYDTQLGNSGIWIAVFCLSILNIIDMSEKDIQKDEYVRKFPIQKIQHITFIRVSTHNERYSDTIQYEYSDRYCYTNVISDIE